MPIQRKQELIDEIDDILARLEETEDKEEIQHYTELLDEKHIELEDVKREIRILTVWRFT
jgi:ATP-dependent Lon protease